MIGLVWAQSADGVIGVDGTIPWRVPEDLAHFSALTAGSTVVMGRATWESLPPRFRPLPGRRNLVLSRERGYVAEGAEVVHDLALALAGPGDVWVIGGSAVYAAALEHADVLVVTEVDLVVAPPQAAPAAPVARAPGIGPGWERAEVGGWATSTAGPRFRIGTWRRSGRTPRAAGEFVAP